MPAPQAPALLLTARGCRLRYERTWETFRGLTVSAGMKPPPAGTTPGTPPGPWKPSDSTRHEQNGHDATTPGPWRLLYSSAYLHRLALEEGEVIGRGLPRSGDPRGHQGLEGIGPQPIGAAGEVPLLEVCTCGMVHDR